MLPSAMQTLLYLLAQAVATTASKSWAGSSNYYLHGLSESDQNSYIDSLQDVGAKVVRLWVSGVSSTCTKSSSTNKVANYEDTIGEYSDSTLDALDGVLSKLHSAGIKAIISLHDANLLPPDGSDSGYNGIDIYGSTYGSSDNFYNDETAQSQFDARVKSILEYVSPNFGTRWADLSDVILAFDIQNEPMIASKSLLEQNDPSGWLCARASKMRNILGSSTVQVSTGGIGGSQYSGHEYNLLPAALDCSDIDMLAIHAYMSTEVQWTPYVPKLSQTANDSGKLAFIEEWGVGTDSSDDSIAKQAALFNQHGVPWLYWMVILGKSVDETCASSDGSCCHSGLSTDDGQDYEISLTSDRADLAGLFGDATSATALQDWSDFL